jgi:hypothetical protein
MKRVFLMISSLFLFSCTSLGDQASEKKKLFSREPDFGDAAIALEKLPCIPHDLAGRPMTLEFGSSDKIVQLKSSRSYVKKICFKQKTKRVALAGKHVGGGGLKAFFAQPSVLAFLNGTLVSGKQELRKKAWSGDLELSFASPADFDTILVYPDTQDMDVAISSTSNMSMVGRVPMISKVQNYKFPTGKIEVSSGE